MNIEIMVRRSISIDKQRQKNHCRRNRAGLWDKSLKFQHQNLTIAVLTELTGLDEDTISAKLERNLMTISNSAFFDSVLLPDNLIYVITSAIYDF